MLSSHNVLGFALLALVIIVVPGPSVLFVVSRGVALGRRAALATVVGNALGLYAQVVAVALGLGAILQQSILVFEAVKLAGAAYLVYLGVRAWRARHELAEALAQPLVSRAGTRIVREGFVVGVSNPKSALLFAAILPQFVDVAAGAVPLQMLALGTLAVGIALVSDSTWALAAGTARAWLARSPRRLSALGGAGGLVMIGLGVRLAFVGRDD
jgi:threonine/homoserine/homoserine lactone efflux protein